MPAEEFSISQFGELTATIPAILGFVPERSLVFLFLEEEMDTARVGVKKVARMDIEDYRRAPHGLEGTQWAGTAKLAMVAVIDDRATGPQDRAEHQELVRTITADLQAHGVQLMQAWAATATAPDARWWTLTDERTGTVPDPAAQPFTAYAVTRGVNIGRSRAEVEARFTIDDARRDAVAQHIDAAMDECCAQLAAAVEADEFEQFAVRQLAQVLDQIEQYDPVVGADPAVAAYVAARLGDPEIMADLFRLVGGEFADQAEALWFELTRCLYGPGRAIAATLYGFSAYALRADGASARIALELAVEENPESRLAHLLLCALDLGIAPDRIRAKFGVPITQTA